MRVGYVLRWYPARSETFVSSEIDGLLQRGVEVEVASLGARDAPGRARVAEAPVYSAPRGLDRLRWLSGLRPGDRRLLAHQRPKDALRLPWLRALARERRWDRIHVHFAGEALEVALEARTGLPVSVTVHGSDLFRPRPSLQALLPRCALVVTVCEHHRRWLARHHGVGAVVVRCGVDPDAFEPADVGGAGRLRVISVARDVPKKGLDQLVRCLPDDAELRLVSPAPRLAGPRVDVGPLDPTDVPSALAAAQVFALPCRIAPDGDRDGVPVALMEAMASGLPVVTTRVSGIPELVDDAVGWLVPPDDDRALRQALEEARIAQERLSRGAAGRERVRRSWTVASQADDLLGAFSSVAD